METMLTWKLATPLWKSLLALAALSLLVGCDELGPGDYRVYRVAFEQVELEANCFDSGAVPVDAQDDSSSLFVSGTYVLFVGPNDGYYLDTGTEALKGTASGENFTFSGRSTTVVIEGDPMMPNATRTTTTQTEVKFNLSGEVVEGDVREDVTFNCTGPDCQDPTDTACTRSAPFIGGEVADVELNHEV
jgi:hypothetical protein